MGLWEFLKNRGWSAISDHTKYFFAGLFIVLLGYGIPRQFFGVVWETTVHLLWLYFASSFIAILWQLFPWRKESVIDVAITLAGSFLMMLFIMVQ